MSDVHSPEKRSYNMSQIKGSNTSPERAVRKYLFSKGFRYRKNVSTLPGCPDIVLPKYRTAVFVNGCFWHMHIACDKFVWPKTNADFWRKKILNNAERDKRNYAGLKSMGWRVIIVWECELSKTNFEKRMNELIGEILKNVYLK